MAINFQRMAEYLPDAVACLDRQGQFTYINRATENILNCHRDAILGKTHHDLDIDPELAEQAHRNVLQVCAADQDMTFTYQYQDHHYEACLIPRYDDDEQIIGVLSISRDVTDRVKLAETLEKERYLAQNIVDAVRSPMLVLDHAFSILSVNDAFTNYFSIEEDDLTGQALKDVCGGQFDVPGLFSLIDRVRRPTSESFYGFDVEMNVKNKGQRTLRLNARQIDHLKLILLSMEDVTQQIEAIESLETDLRHKHEDLAEYSRRLRELVVELSETEDRERERLSDLLHDDLQQMLVAVSYQLQMAKAKSDDPEQTRTLIVEAIDYVKQAIDKSRNLSHELSPAFFRQRGLKDSLQSLADQMQQQHNLEVKLNCDGDIDAIASSLKILLFKAIREMLFNIVKHAEVHEAQMKLTRQRDHVEAMVWDHGKGFDLEAVLENRSGKGLGLFNIRERLDLLGGSLEVQSTQGKGSKFRMIIPLKNEQLEEAAEQVHDSEEPASA